MAAPSGAASVPACGSIGVLSGTGGEFVIGRGRAAPAPGSVGAIAFRCRPHCWQYAKPVGVDVPQRGHVIVLPCADTRSGVALGPASGALPGAPGGVMPFAGALGTGVANGPAGGIPGNGGPGGGPGGAIIGAPNAGDPGVVPASAAPQFRQNFIPGGFSPRQAEQITGNPAPPPGVCGGAAASAVPQFKQNDDPGGLWWPQAEQRSITPLLPRVSRKATRWEMGRRRFATEVPSC